MKNFLSPRVTVDSSIDYFNEHVRYYFARSCATKDFPRGFAISMWTTRKCDIRRVLSRAMNANEAWQTDISAGLRFSPEYNAAYFQMRAESY